MRLKDQGDYIGARSCQARSLAMRMDILGEQHPLTAESLWWMGVILMGGGELEKAKPYLERALAVYTAEFGPDHPSTNGVREHLDTLNAALAGLDDE